MGQAADERIDLAQGHGRRPVALEVAAHEAVIGQGKLQGRGAGVVDGRGAVFLHEAEDAEDPPDTGFALAAMNALAEGADVGAGAAGLREEAERGRRRAGWPILRGADAPPGRLAAV